MTDFTTPKLVVTNAGLAAASVATPTGPSIETASFNIGSAYGYTLLPTDTDINGDLLYEGTPLTERDSWWAAGSLPDRITIFRGPTLRMCGSRDEVVDVNEEGVDLGEMVK